MTAERSPVLFAGALFQVIVLSVQSVSNLPVPGVYPASRAKAAKVKSAVPELVPKRLIVNVAVSVGVSVSVDRSNCK